MDVSVIIVTYNSAGVVRESLNAVSASCGCTLEAFVVDNCSSDSCAQLVRHDFPWVRLLANDRNRGFGAANNQALPLCTGRYIVFLNPDAQVKPDAIKQAVAFMDQNRSIGLAGLRMLFPDGSPQDSVSYRYPGEKYAYKELGELPGSIAAVMGAAMIVRSDLIKLLKGFDEDFFLYGEDQDLCLRIRKAGYLIGCIPDAVVEHIGGHSENSFPSGDVWRKKMKAELLFYRKHYSKRAFSRARTANLLKCRWRTACLSFARCLGVQCGGLEAKMTKYRTITRTLVEEK